MTYGVDVWVPDPETGGEKVETRFPCSICGCLVVPIYIVNDDIQLCTECYNPRKEYSK